MNRMERKVKKSAGAEYYIGGAAACPDEEIVRRDCFFHATNDHVHDVTHTAGPPRWRALMPQTCP